MSGQTSGTFTTTTQSGIVQGKSMTVDLTFASSGSVTVQRDLFGDSNWVSATLADGTAATFTANTSYNFTSNVPCNWRLNCTDATGNVTYKMAVV